MHYETVNFYFSSETFFLLFWSSYLFREKFLPLIFAIFNLMFFQRLLFLSRLYIIFFTDFCAFFFTYFSFIQSYLNCLCSLRYLWNSRNYLGFKILLIFLKVFFCRSLTFETHNCLSLRMLGLFLHI